MEKKPFYKKPITYIIGGVGCLGLILIAIIATFILALTSTTDDAEKGESEKSDEVVEDTAESDDSENEKEQEDEELTASEEIESKIKEIVDEDLNSTFVIELDVNEDASVDEERYIVLVDLEWSVKNKPDTTKEMLDMYSDHLAAKMADNDLVHRLVIFWEVPYHKEEETILKRTYENKEGNMYLEDEFKDIDIFE